MGKKQKIKKQNNTKQKEGNKRLKQKSVKKRTNNLHMQRTHWRLAEVNGWGDGPNGSGEQEEQGCFHRGVNPGDERHSTGNAARGAAVVRYGDRRQMRL